MDIRGNGCKLTEPVYGTQFDLNELRSELTKNVKSVVNDADFVAFNVCDNTTLECAGKKSIACLTKNGKNISFGKYKRYEWFHEWLNRLELFTHILRFRFGP